MTIETFTPASSIKIEGVDQNTLDTLRHSVVSVNFTDKSYTLHVRTPDELRALDAFLHLIRKNV